MAFLSFDDGATSVANYLLYSEQFDNAVWNRTTGVTITPNAATSPDGTNDGDFIVYDGTGTTDNFRIYQTALAPLAPAVAGTAVTVSVWLKAPTPVTVRLVNNMGGSTVCNVTTTWQRFSVTSISNGASVTQLLIYSVGNAAWTIYAWGAQAQIGTYATAYIPTTSAAVASNSLHNDYPGTPASRFTGWTPTSRPHGDGVTRLSDAALVFFEERTDYGASFSLDGIPVKAQADGANRVAMADRLIAHLMRGGTVLVQTDDSGAANSGVYKTCGLWPGSSPSLRLTDRRNFLYTLSLELVNRAASPVRMDAVYAP